MSYYEERAKHEAEEKAKRATLAKTDTEGSGS